MLSQLVEAMRTGRPRSYVTEYHAPWGVLLPPTSSANFHVLLEGEAVLFPGPTGDEEPIQVRSGDLLFMPRGGLRGMADSVDTPLHTAEFEESNFGVWTNSGGVHRRAPVPSDSGSFNGHHSNGSSFNGHHSNGSSFNGSHSNGIRPSGARPSAVVVCGTYQLDQARMHPLLQELPPVVHLATGLGRRPALRGAVELLYNETRGPQAGTDLVVPALIDTLLLYILRSWLEETPCGDQHRGWGPALQDPAMSAALEGIHRAPSQPWTVQRLGEVAGLSRAAFARRFTEMVGQPPMAYLTWWRLTGAAKLLRSTDLPLSAIAERVGYATEFALGNAFKREFGVAPGLYRRQRERPEELAPTW